MGNLSDRGHAITEKLSFPRNSEPLTYAQAWQGLHAVSVPFEGMLMGPVLCDYLWVTTVSDFRRVATASYCVTEVPNSGSDSTIYFSHRILVLSDACWISPGNTFENQVL